MTVPPGDEPEIRVRLDQPLNDAVDAIEQAMVLRALERARRQLRERRPAARDLAQGPVPQAPPLGDAARVLTGRVSV